MLPWKKQLFGILTILVDCARAQLYFKSAVSLTSYRSFVLAEWGLINWLHLITLLHCLYLFVGRTSSHWSYCRSLCLTMLPRAKVSIFANISCLSVKTFNNSLNKAVQKADLSYEKDLNKKCWKWRSSVTSRSWLSLCKISQLDHVVSDFRLL